MAIDLIPVTVKTFRGSVHDDEYKKIHAACTARGLKHFEVWHMPKDTATEPGEYHINNKVERSRFPLTVEHQEKVGKDHDVVFSTSAEFLEHHTSGPFKSWEGAAALKRSQGR